MSDTFGAECAHMSVRYGYTTHGDGTLTGHWACVMCDRRFTFAPAQAQRCSTCARWNTSRNCPVRSTRGPGWYCADWEERFVEPTTDGEGGKQ